jgi:WD40 repeat protein
VQEAHSERKPPQYGKRAVSASSDRTLKVWDLDTGRVTQTLEGHTETVTAVAVTGDGKRAISASGAHEAATSRFFNQQRDSAAFDTTIKLWDLATGRVVRTLEAHTEEVNAVAIVTDGKHAISASFDKTLKVWDLATGRVTQTLDGHTVTAVAVTADGKRAVSASYDRTLKVWDPDGGRAVRMPEGHLGSINGVAIITGGKCAISASADNTLKVWDLEAGRVTQTLEDHTAEVTAVAVTADGKRAVSASYDTTLKVWNLDTGRIVRSLVLAVGDRLWNVATPLRFGKFGTGEDGAGPANLILDLHIPNAHGIVAGGRGEGLAVGPPGDGGDALSMAFESAEKSSRGGVPEAHGVVIGGGGEDLAVGPPGDGVDALGMAFESAEESSGGRVPEAHGVVIGGGGEGLAVRPPGDGVDALGMAFESAEESSGGRVPEAHGVIRGGGREGLAVGPPGDGGDPHNSLHQTHVWPRCVTSCSKTVGASGIGSLGREATSRLFIDMTMFGRTRRHSRQQPVPVRRRWSGRATRRVGRVVGRVAEIELKIPCNVPRQLVFPVNDNYFSRCS